MIEKTIRSLLDGGEVLFKYPLKVYCRKDGARGGGVFVVSVPKRRFKRAVKRNLLKRRIREAFRHSGWKDSMEGDVMIIYAGEKVEDYETILSSVSFLFEKSSGMAAGKAD